MKPLESPIRGYAWGSHDAIAALQGRPPSEGPEAELWMGAHPASPSSVDGVPLTSVIAADPASVLGASTVDRYGARLPFLLKVLAAAQPLSLQAHPDLDQARAGYAAEEAAGVPADAPGRTYVDAWHKPEMLVAVEEFDALCGFRDPAASSELLASLDVNGLKPVVDSLSLASPAEALREAVHGLLVNTPASLVDEVVAAAARVGGEARLAVELAERYPGDVGVIVALLLNRVRLAPDQAVWMPAGNLHAYLRGVGVEIMAASDNVLRGGLTPKHVNVDELLRVLRFEVLDDPVVHPVPVVDGVLTWPAPVGDFALYRAEVGTPVELAVQGPRIVLCLRGEIVATDGGGETRLTGGHAAFGRSGGGPVRLTGTGTAYIATLG